MVLFCLLRQACDIVDAIDIFFLRTDPSPPDLGRKACFRSVTSLGGFGYSFALTQAVVYPILFHIDGFSGGRLFLLPQIEVKTAFSD